MKVYLETMGCQMNRLDSELVTSMLRAAGHEMVDDSAAADVVLYNTCSVRKHAEEKVFSRLGAQGQRKSAGKRIVVGVLGCMAQRLGQELRDDFPQVDVVCSSGQLHRLADMVAQAAGGRAGVALDPRRPQPPDELDERALDALDLGRDVRAAAGSQAFVRISRGCDKFCSYCIVPTVRGPERSRDPRQIVEETRRLVDAGKSEITLLGQTVNSYRWMGGGPAVRFSDLLAQVAAVGGLRRLRFITSHPIDFGDDVLHAMRDLPNICPYIHVPAQSGSDAVLARMNRRYTRAQYDDLIDRARAIVPDVVLAGDFIVGFPGETDADHAASAELIRRSGYKNSFIFKYSPRPGTAAARLKDDVPPAVKKQRNNELLAVQAEVSLAHNQRYIGRQVEVLVEGRSPRSMKQAHAAPRGMVQLVGRTRGDHIVVLDGPASLAGRYVAAEILSVTALTLVGRLADEA
jgi:tRNA-2-methylthio-N6-dimethylallyladenosine synthase